MKILVLFYSRTGTTRKLAQKISKILKSDLDEIIDQKNRQSLAGWISGGKDAATEKLTTIENKINPQNYDLVIIGTPVWVGNVTPAIRTYLTNNKFNKVAFFCTCGDKQNKTFQTMQNLSKIPETTLEIKTRDIEKKHTEQKIRQFCQSLKNNKKKA